MLLTTSRELIAASAIVVLVVIVLPATMLALLRWRHSRRLDRMFAVLPNGVRRRLLRQPSSLKQAPSHRRISYLHCSFDIGQSEDAKAQLKFSASLRHALVQAVLLEGGILDFQSASGLGAYWNAPLRDSDHAFHACAAALRMNDRIVAQNRFPLEMAKENPRAEIAIGIATGEAAVGFAGTHYLVDGAAPRRAVRLAQLCPSLGFSILTDSETQSNASSGFALLPMRETARDTDTHSLYALLGGVKLRRSPQFRAAEIFHSRIFTAIGKSDWTSAKLFIAQARKLSGANSLYYDRLAGQIDEATKTPAVAAQIAKAA